MKNLEDCDWKKIVVRNTTKGKLTGEYRFARIFIWNKSLDQIESRTLVIRRTMPAKNTTEIKYSFTNANLEQYTQEGLAYMQAHGFIAHLQYHIKGD